ncbi:ABC transporter ATP-binding protein [Abyssisolibacter fermentans]|uniref:ABC transporter ATP-binding protein n=1 Tax=Abyssisolibacter fermentans TaxID=1766203 RepID=UPI000835945F|nr:ABC transporter ATP-binding protein [Abyssisolibacter fermentans]
MSDWIVTNLSKHFGKTKSIDDISFEIEENKIYGLIGRNGAGKTTLLKLLANQLIPTTGEIRIDGKLLKNDDELTQTICLSRDFIKLCNNIKGIKVKRLIEFASYIYPNWDQAFANEIIKDFNLDTNKKYDKLSRGMQTCVGIVIGLASRAPMTLFDEPYIGLDPIVRELFYEKLLSDYEENPRTIIISTHLINELENLFEHIYILHKGKLILNTSTEETKLKAQVLEGDKDRIESVLAGKRIINKQIIGRMATYTVYDSFTDAEKRVVKDIGIDFKPINLQKLFINLSKGGDKI